MTFVSGVDGGATKTVAVVGRLDGTLLASARGPSSNYHNVGVGKAAKSVRTSVLAACRHAHVSASNLETVVMGLAGMDCPRDFRVGERVADLTDLGRQRMVVHDSVIAIYAATLGRPGIVVNAGTGSFAAGIDAHGRTIRAGGWGSIIDDEGSAYDTGRLGIRAALRALDGSEKKTAITRLLVRKFRLRTLEDLVYLVYRKPMMIGEISAVSKMVAQAALSGDRVARDIFVHEGRVLAELVSAVARCLDMTKSRPEVYYTGGLFGAGSIILNPFKHELRRSVPSFILRHPTFEPAIGAFILALKDRGVTAQGPTLRNLRASYARYAVNMG